MEISVRELCGTDINYEFLTTLTSLAEVQLKVPEALEYFRKRLRDGIRTYIAIRDDHIVGTATLMIEQKFIHQGGRVGHIEDVAVHRLYQRQGVGKALIEHAVAEARQVGCYKVVLDCFDDRVSFYEGLGFHAHNVGMRLDLGEPGEACKSASSVIPTAATAR